MPSRTCRGAIALVLVFLAGLCAVPSRAAEIPVDLELVLAVDISNSMDPEEQRLQRQGYVSAITSPEVLSAIGAGRQRRIAVAYVEWAGFFEQRVVLDWQVIDGAAAARAWADALLAKPYRNVSRTSISGVIRFATPLFDQNGYDGERRVIDVSGDGSNNQGPSVTEARDAALARGIVINGLPIILKRPNYGFQDVTDLDLYYEDCVIGGEGSFMIPIRDLAAFETATRMKLLLEVAGLAPDPGTVRKVAQRRPSFCLGGEELWRRQ